MTIESWGLDMQGNITNIKNKDGSISYRFRVSAGVDVLSGKRIQLTKRIKSNQPIPKRDLNKLLREFILECESGQHNKSSDITLANLLNEWIDAAKTSNNVIPVTIKGYVAQSKYLIRYMGNLKVNELNPQLISQGLNRIRKHKGSNTKKLLSDRTHIYIFRVLDKCLKWAVTMEILQFNPMDKLDRPKRTHTKADTINNEDFQKVYEYLSTTKQWAVAPTVIALRTAARRSEVVGLKWNDIDLDKNLMMIQRSLSTKPAGIHIGEAKNDQSRRSIYLSKESKQVFRDRYYEQKKQADLLGLPLTKDDYIFSFPVRDESRVTKEFGYWSPIRPASLGIAYSNACKHLGIKSSFHKLRHTHATVLLKKNINPKIVQERLGHSSISTTMDTYSHALPTMQASAVESFEEDFKIDSGKNNN